MAHCSDANSDDHHDSLLAFVVLRVPAPLLVAEPCGIRNERVPSQGGVR